MYPIGAVVFIGFLFVAYFVGESFWRLRSSDINHGALVGLGKAVDRILTHDLVSFDPDALAKLKAEERERQERFEQQIQADDARLREYNEQWIKNNVPPR